MTPEQAERIREYQEDFPLFAREQLKILTKDRGLQPFELNRMQRQYWRDVKGMIDEERPVRIYNLKARQTGSSTFWQGIGYWQGSLRKYRRGLTVSHEDVSATELFSKESTFYAHSADWVRPTIKRSNRQELYFTHPDPKKAGLESKMLVQTANNRNLGASQTIHFLHLSEYARYEALLQNFSQTMASLLPTVPYAPLTFIIKETTAQGMGKSMEEWFSDSEYLKRFSSWIADETYTEEEGIDPATIQPVDAGPWGNEEAIHELILAEIGLWYPERAEDREWVEAESLRRLAWRRRQVRDTFDYDRDLFRQEYPLTPEEAFLTSGRSVFNPLKLGDMMSLLDSEGDTPTGHRFDAAQDKFYEAPNGPLRVYRRPVPGGIYVVGADSSYGVQDGDFAAAQVLRLPEYDQVAVFQDRVEPDDFADILAALGTWYNLAYIAPETFGPGMATVLRLRKRLLYPHIYRRESFDKRTKRYRDQVGWITSSSSKPVLVAGLLGAFRDDAWRLRDMETLREMSFFTEQGGKFQAEPGKHDDLVISLGLAIQMALQLGPIAIRPKDRDPATIPGTVAHAMRDAGRDETYSQPGRL